MNYKFSILRYFHDPISEEFINVGIAIYFEEIYFLDFRYLNKYSRLSRTFLEVDGEHFKKVLSSIHYKFNDISHRLKNHTLFESKIDFDSLIREVLPPDDSSLRFSQEYFGVADNPDETLDYLFQRYVTKYIERGEKFSRSDEEVWKVFKKPLEEKKIIHKLRPYKIITKDYEHNFEHCWKNNIWYINEPISFDLQEASTILEKANTWLGRGTSLSEKKDFKLYLLLGEPKDNKLKNYFIKAENIMNKMPCEHEFIREDDAEKFAEELTNIIEDHK